MCCTTKMKIAHTLRELMKERSMRKITVQDIMERTNMKRQSFYYHFKDVYDVLEWEVNRQLAQTLQYDPEQDCEAWCLSVLEALDRDRAFYRKTIQAVGVQKARAYVGAAIQPHVCQLLLNHPYPELEQLSDEERYLLDFFERSICSELVVRVLDRESLDLEHSRRRIQMLCRMAEQCAHIPSSLFSAS